MTDYKEANLPEVQTPDKLQAAKTFITGYVNKITGDDAESTVTFKELFSDMFRKHDKTDTDILLYSGTAVAKGAEPKVEQAVPVFAGFRLDSAYLYNPLRQTSNVRPN
jgi:hypothetical protein